MRSTKLERGKRREGDFEENPEYGRQKVKQDCSTYFFITPFVTLVSGDSPTRVRAIFILYRLLVISPVKDNFHSPLSQEGLIFVNLQSCTPESLPLNHRPSIFSAKAAPAVVSTSDASLAADCPCLGHVRQLDDG